jgi:protein TonB
MNRYEEPSLLSGRKGSALTAVILLHLLFGFAFYSELAGKIRMKLDPLPLDLTPVDTPKQTVKPPPAVPLMNQPRIFATLPEFPSSAPPSDRDMTVDNAAPEQPHTFSSPPPQARVRVPVRMDPKHPLRIGADYYPDASRRANEMGRCVVQVTVAADGRIIAAMIQTHTGFDRLDQACLNGVRGQRMLPATEDGKPVESTVSVPILWNLTE